MNLMCPCATHEGTVNPNPHPCVWVLPWQAAALIARPIETIHTWRKAGHIDSRRCPETGRWQVCNCEALTRSNGTATRWRRSIA
jgi:hypothetical protein